MTIRVRLFGALADAAGQDRLQSDAVTLDELRAELSARFGEPFASRLARSRAWVDGDDMAPFDLIAAGSEVALLPPFAGG